MPAHGALGKHQRLMRGGFQRPPHHLFRMAQPIDGGRINPVHALIEGLVDGVNRFLIVLGSPCELPVSAPNCPRPKADRRQLKI